MVSVFSNEIRNRLHNELSQNHIPLTVTQIMTAQSIEGSGGMGTSSVFIPEKNTENITFFMSSALATGAQMAVVVDVSYDGGTTFHALHSSVYTKNTANGFCRIVLLEHIKAPRWQVRLYNSNAGAQSFDMWACH